MIAITATDGVEVFGTTITYGGLISAVVVAVVSIVAAVVLRQVIVRRSRRQDAAHASTWYTLSRLVTYCVLTLGFFVAIAALGVPLSRFAVLAGAIGVGLGFGLQPLFANFVAGVVLLIDKSLKVGDFVELESGATGQVRDIKMRATAIVTNDNIDILVPNSEFVSGRVVNWTHREVRRRLRIPFGVAYGTDKDLVRQAALEAAAAVPFTLDLEGPLGPQVWLSEFGDSALEFELVVWLNPEATMKPIAVMAAYNWALHTALQKHGIEIPFPQRDLNVRTLFGLSGDDARAALRLSEPSEASDASGRPRPDAAHRRDAGGVRGETDRNDAVGDVSGQTGYAPERADGALGGTAGPER